MNEVEIKFRVADIGALEKQLRAAGFELRTQRTHEFNTIYDLPDKSLRLRGELLRLRKYGDIWTVTHKSKGSAGKHKSRKEIETKVEDGEQLAQIFRSLGYVPTFRYEKFRTEWASAGGMVVIDETPIGTIAEIEGEADWIDRTAKTLGVKESEYSTKSYSELFAEWKRNSGSGAAEMTWQAVGEKKP
jgi:adenylate cyclase class 2